MKEIIIPRQSNAILFVFGPCITLIFALLGWAIIPFGEGLAIFDWDLGVFFALAVSSIGSYGILISGWAANSKYPFMGAIRSTAQLLSYELVFSSIVLILIIFSGSFSLSYIVECQQAVWNIFPLLPIALMFFISILAETNRPPMDLPEAIFGLFNLDMFLYLFYILSSLYAKIYFHYFEKKKFFFYLCFLNNLILLISKINKYLSTYNSFQRLNVNIYLYKWRYVYNYVIYTLIHVWIFMIKSYFLILFLNENKGDDLITY